MFQRDNRFDAGNRNELHQGVERSQQRLFVCNLECAIILSKQRHGHGCIQGYIGRWFALKRATGSLRGRRPESRQGLPNRPLRLRRSCGFLQFVLRRRDPEFFASKRAPGGIGHAPRPKLRAC